jgi:flavin reductase (DIM6/NTAB) family NADH-FMN oxidoreductase RutF
MKKAVAPQPFEAAMSVVIVSTKDGEKMNFAPHGMFGIMSYEPPLLYISVIKKHMTAKIINKTGRFGVNIPNTKLLDKIKYCGSVSGIDKDKSQEFDVFYGSSDVPMISECPVNMNCEVYNTIDTKDMIIYVAKVIETFADEEFIVDSNIDAFKVDPMLCTIQGKYFGLGDLI